MVVKLKRFFKTQWNEVFHFDNDSLKICIIQL